MKRRITALTASVALGWGGAAFGDMSVDERLERMEQRIRDLEDRLERQNDVIREKDRKLARLEESDGKETDWFQNVEIHGLIEVEAGYQDPYRGKSTSDVILATAELGVAAKLNDWVAGEITLLYEEDETDLEVDVATIRLAPPEGPWLVSAGQFYVPFGVFDSNMVSDPLTLEIGETRESSLRAGFERGGAFGSVYVFNGTNKKNGDNQINNWGANLGYGKQSDRLSVAGSLSYINDIGDSDTLQDALASNDVKGYTAGWGISMLAETGPFTLIGEYLGATEEFDPPQLDFKGEGARPSAWGIEAGYGFHVAGRDATFALGYQGTSEALALDLPERRLLAALSVGIMERTALSFEWAHDNDYDVADGGTGESADTLTAQLAVEF